MSGLRMEMGLQDDPAWPSNEALHTEEARQYFLRLVSAPSSPFGSAFGSHTKARQKERKNKIRQLRMEHCSHAVISAGSPGG